MIPSRSLSLKLPTPVPARSARTSSAMLSAIDERSDCRRPMICSIDELKLTDSRTCTTITPASIVVPITSSLSGCES